VRASQSCGAEAERAIVGPIGAVSSAIEEGHYVYGGALIEMERQPAWANMQRRWRPRANWLLQAFAEALEFIPHAGREHPAWLHRYMVALRSKHSTSAMSRGASMCTPGKVADVKTVGVA